MIASVRVGDKRVTERQNTASAGNGTRRARHRRVGRSTRPCAAPFEPAAAPKRLAVFVSGGGSNFKQIHKGCLDGSIRGDIVAVVTDVPTCGAVSYAQEHGISVHVYPQKQAAAIGDDADPTTSRSAPLTSPADVVAMLQQEQVQLVLLAGYLKLVPAEVVAAFHRKMLNIHPGLLPAFGGKGMYGKRVHQSVISSGSRYSGATIHFVDEEYDTGPIVAQGIVPCHPDDTAELLAARVLRLEHELYPATVAALCDDRIAWRDDGIPFVWQKV